MIFKDEEEEDRQKACRTYPVRIAKTTLRDKCMQCCAVRGHSAIFARCTPSSADKANAERSLPENAGHARLVVHAGEGRLLVDLDTSAKLVSPCLARPGILRSHRRSQDGALNNLNVQYRRSLPWVDGVDLKEGSNTSSPIGCANREMSKIAQNPIYDLPERGVWKVRGFVQNGNLST